ncbi:hypothetical protein [Rodentibacter caecimuris]|uniref:hypothetical protein n=1 Tax=Rodentibacter caecimuris TaxID=1796644 RepID=UPI0012FF8F6E|nr:hypothetical protein [Rodentibacter heylii]
MLDDSPFIWVQDAFQITDKSQDKVLILVLGGINVYRYRPDKMELEKIWVAY